ncbi:hypothetical protein ACFWP5_34905 [Streptomyces sp. NPDC058469]|uniref:hypothetical protein n=1 Tax=Streptomyces sp. NPDC058469 TaxID=3346514 RepID=UPI0036582ABB
MGVAGLRREELAVLAGARQPYYARLEQGQSTAAPELPEVIAQALRQGETECRCLSVQDCVAVAALKAHRQSFCHGTSHDGHGEETEVDGPRHGLDRYIKTDGDDVGPGTDQGHQRKSEPSDAKCRSRRTANLALSRV